MVPGFDVTANELLFLFFFVLVWPPLVTMLVCGVAGWMIPRIHWLIGIGLGIPMGAVNILLPAPGLALVINLEWVDAGWKSRIGFWDVLAVQMFFILLGSGIPVLGMLWWSRRRQPR